MIRKTIRLAVGALAALASFAALASAACATTTVHIEYLRGDYVYSAETISSSGSSTAGTAAPANTGQARITVLSGAAVVKWGGTSPTATQTNGVRIEAGRAQPITVTLGAGEAVAIIEASDAPAQIVAPTVFASSGNVANAAATATMAGTAGKSNYIAGLYVTGSGATAASVVLCQVQNLVGGNMGFQVVVPAGVTASINSPPIYFNPPLAATAGFGLVVTCPAFGAGNTNAYVTEWGFKQ